MSITLCIVLVLLVLPKVILVYREFKVTLAFKVYKVYKV